MSERHHATEQRNDPPWCPGCGKNELARDEVDIGVGVQYGPWGCMACGWTEPVKDYGLTVEGCGDEF